MLAIRPYYRRAALPALLGAFLCCLAPAASASVVVRLNDQALFDASDAVITGKVTRMQTLPSEDNNNIYTYVTVAVEETLAGEVNDSEVVLKQLGGQHGTRLAWLDGAPRFAVGDEVLLFLNRNTDDTLRVTGLFQGQFRLKWSAQKGKRLALRDFAHSGATVLGMQGARVSEERTYGGLREWIRAQAAKRVSARPVQARTLVTRPAELTLQSQKAQETKTTAEPYGLLGLKWDANDLPVAFRVSNSSQVGVPGGGITEVATAFAAWSNIPGSYFTAGLSGLSGPQPIFLCDGRNTVNFNDPFHELPDDGTLAVGGGCASSSLIINTLGGDKTSAAATVVGTFTEADLTFNDGFVATSTFVVPGCFQAVATHETGHAIGMGHSGDPGAIMYPFIIPNMCDYPFPRSDDVAGMLDLYGIEVATGDAPATPGGLSLSSEGTVLTIEWSPSEGATSYDIIADGLCDPCANVPGPPVVAEVPAGTYSIRVRARGPFGSSAPTEAKIIVVGQGGGGVSGDLKPPASVTASVEGSTVSIAWAAVIGADSYELVALNVCDPCAVVPGTALVVEGVPPGIYQVGIRSRAGGGRSEISDTITVLVN